MSLKINYAVLVAFLVAVKQTTPLKVYVLKDTLAKRPVDRETSIYLKPIVKSNANIKKSFCRKEGIVCLLTSLQDPKVVLRGGEDTKIEITRSESHSEEDQISSSEFDSGYQAPNFDDLTRGTHKETKLRVIKFKPVEIEETDIDISKLGEHKGFSGVSGRKLGKIVKKKGNPKIISYDNNQDSDDRGDEDDDEADDEVDDEVHKEESRATNAQSGDENGEGESKSGETEKSTEKDDASPETEEQTENIEQKPKRFRKIEATVFKKIKPDKKFIIPKRFEVVDNGEDGNSKQNSNSGKDEEFSETEDKSVESLKKPDIDTDIDLTDIEEKNSIEIPTEKADVVEMKDTKEKYSYVQGLDRYVQVGKKKESSEEKPPIEDDKTAEEDEGLLYRRSRLQHFLPKRYFWDDDDYKNLGYFWHNGPQGNSPGNYRIRYK